MKKSGKIAEFQLQQVQELMDRLRVRERWTLPFDTVQVRMTALHGAKRAAGESKRYVAKVILVEAYLLCGTILLSVWNGPAMWAAGLILMLLYFWYSFKKLDQQVKLRKRLIVMELPELLNKLTLLINAGETLHQAIHRCVDASREELHPLCREWAVLSRSLKDNKPFVTAMEEFSRSCSVLEVSMFTTSLLMNFRRGGGELVASLMDLSHTLWERRKAAVKIMGEEASSKLVFPMVLLFCAVMVIVAAPALLMMS